MIPVQKVLVGVPTWTSVQFVGLSYVARTKSSPLADLRSVSGVPLRHQGIVVLTLGERVASVVHYAAIVVFFSHRVYLSRQLLVEVLFLPLYQKQMKLYEQEV